MYDQREKCSVHITHANPGRHGARAGTGFVTQVSRGAGLTFTVRQDVSVAASAYFSYGPAPAGARLRSEYGAAPLAALLQLRIYF